MQKYRVAQWGTGHTGMHTLRKLIEHPHYDLVGAYVYSEEKAGRDAGELSGGEPIGVIATREIDDIIAAKPDCVLYMPMLDHESIDDMCRLLESGSNIVTIVPTFYHPASYEPDVRDRFVGACERGGTSMWATGGSPNFIDEVLPTTLALMERRLDRLSIVQYADVSERRSPEMLRTFFGNDPAEVDMGEPTKRLVISDGDSLRQLGDSLGMPVDDVRATAEPSLATKTIDLGTITIEAGTVGAWNQVVTAYRNDEPFLSFCRMFFVTRDLDPPLDLRDNGWRVIVEGDAPLDVEIRFTKVNYGATTPGYNGHLAVNSIPAVCEASPGLLTADQLRLVPYLG